ncbi:phosphoribosylamine--glycine ligase [Cellulomonas terrae]|uniref:Phosphoribosylamine--glycine ligase n=1 Tax=Cellulomonas terrae TaxID=311234 RepID=A0A511JK18_9CELL|nr:phosphoribosylamine--glycine ligase [Cellulomonas terrae]GEL98358.1 phosphoribosylamine--glycine ligase [Cellulomonas terrae]
MVVGSGGREHAIVHHLLTNDPSVEVIAAPGNPGIAGLCRTVDVAVTDVEGLTRLATDEQVDCAIVGPEVALDAGVADALRTRAVPVLGAGRDASRLETSKSWAKDLMIEAGIPTATAVRFQDSAAALAHIATHALPLVVKADGLAQGKGAVVCRTRAEAEQAVTAMLDTGVFGTSGSTVLVEQFLVGEEFSLMVFTDGDAFVPMPISQDHKPVGAGDSGPNTGGMGAYAPVPSLHGAEHLSIERIFVPLLAALRARGIDYRGVITANLIWTADGPHVIEFNARFGDPEAEVTLPLLETDLVTITRAVDGRSLHQLDVRWRDGSALCVVMAASGYPGAPRAGDAITLPTHPDAHSIVFHAGTSVRDGQLVTSGGRVLIVTGVGGSFAEARERAYATVDAIRFDGEHHRADIGWRSQAHLADVAAGRREPRDLAQV